MIWSRGNRTKTEEVIDFTKYEGPIIRVRGLSKSLDGSLVLDNVNLDISAGESVSIVGRTGCGKTVLTKHFNGLLVPDSGIVEVFGNDINEMSEARLYATRKKIGYVFQGNALFSSQTIYENVSVPLRKDPYVYPAKNEGEIEKAVKEVLGAVGLGIEFFGRYPSDLSGGQKKRVAVARAMVNRPPIIIYDEPTTGLDPEYTEIIIELIKKFQGSDVTTIAVTHEKKLMEATPRIIFLLNGRVYYGNSSKSSENSSRDFLYSSDPAIRQFLANKETRHVGQNQPA